MNKKLVVLLMALAAMGCGVVERPADPGAGVCDQQLSEEVDECFDDAWMDRTTCWSEVTGDDRFGGYFSNIYDAPLMAQWRGLWEAWLECGDEFDVQLGECAGVALRTENPEVWAPDPYKMCLDPPKNHWGHPVDRPCLVVDSEMWSDCIFTGIDTGACAEAHHVRQEACLDEEDFRQEDCFLNISDIATCEHE
jgi:hypothetical protein